MSFVPAPRIAPGSGAWQLGLSVLLALQGWDQDWDQDWDVLGVQSQPHIPEPTWGLAAALLLPLGESKATELNQPCSGVGVHPSPSPCSVSRNFGVSGVSHCLFLQLGGCSPSAGTDPLAAPPWLCWSPQSSSSGVWGCSLSLSHSQEPMPLVPVQPGNHGITLVTFSFSWKPLAPSPDPTAPVYHSCTHVGASFPCLSQSCSSPFCCLRCPHCCLGRMEAANPQPPSPFDCSCSPWVSLQCLCVLNPSESHFLGKQGLESAFTCSAWCCLFSLEQKTRLCSAATTQCCSAPQNWQLLLLSHPVQCQLACNTGFLLFFSLFWY